MIIRNWAIGFEWVKNKVTLVTYAWKSEKRLKQYTAFGTNPHKPIFENSDKSLQLILKLWSWANRSA